MGFWPFESYVCAGCGQSGFKCPCAFDYLWVPEPYLHAARYFMVGRRV